MFWKKRKTRKIAIIAVAAVAVIAGVLFGIKASGNAKDYKAAEALLAEERYEEAIAAFTELGDYKDSVEQIDNAKAAAIEAEKEENYAAAEQLAKEGKTAEAAIAFGKAIGYMDAQERSFALWEETAMRETVSAGDWHTVGLRADGTVVAAGSKGNGQCNVSDWTDICLPEK